MLEANVTTFLKEENKDPLKDKVHILSCTSCLRKLLEIVEVLDIPHPQRIKSKCPCGGSSFLVILSGKAFTKPLDCAIDTVEHPFDSELTVITCK